MKSKISSLLTKNLRGHWVVALTWILMTGVLIPSEVFAKQLYATVRRDFSPNEQAVIELNYSAEAPIYIRVLSPKDMKGFIASQIDLRRAWRKPRVEFNPMHFLTLGMNDTEFNTDWIRKGTNENLRKSVTELSGGELTEGSPALHPGPERIISIPDAFELVTEQVITPEAQDTGKPFDVPGFDTWWYGTGEFKTKMVQLPALKPGFYLVQAIQGDAEGQVVVVVNDIVTHLQQSTGQLLYRVATRDGAPIANAEITVRNLLGQWVQKGKSDANGVMFLNGVKETELLTVVESAGRGTAIIDSEFFATTAVFPDLYLYTDRPMYRKGDTVHFRGILRQLRGGVSQFQNFQLGTNIRVSLVSVDGRLSQSNVLAKVSEFGTFHGQLKTSDDDAEGVYRVVADLGKTDHVGEIRVKDYVKPLFFVNVSSTQETLQAGQKLNAQVKAERYAGGVPLGARAKVQLFRIRMQAPKWAEDAGLGETGSPTTYFFDQAAESGSAEMPILIHEEADIELGENAEAKISINVPLELPGDPGFDYKFQLKVSVEDADGNFASGTREFFDLASEVTTQARFNHVLAESNKNLFLNIRSTTATGKIYPNAKGFIEFQHRSYSGSVKNLNRVEIQTNDKGRARIQAPTTGNGELIANVTLYDQNRKSSTTSATVLVASEPAENGVISVSELQLISPEPVVGPNDTIRVLALLPENWGEKGSRKGQVFLTVAGKTIHSREVIEVSGLAKWFETKVKPSFGTSVTLIFSYADPETGWTERRSTFRIMDPNQALKISVMPANGTALPGGRQSVKIKVTDQSGKPVRADLSVAVVDRSVLDLQPEIRPTLLDFFYPTDRLNVMSFFSSQFQSYGYAEKITRLFKPNYWFAATKSKSEALDQVDTAHFTGSVITDEKGEAKVSFTLPGNQTIWKTIVLAADAQGRFGEGNAEFKANLPVNLLLGYPQFMRRGDQSQLRMSLTNLESKTNIPIEYQLLPSNNVDVRGQTEIKTQLKAKEQISNTLSLAIPESAESSTTTLLSQLKLLGSDLTFKNNLRILTDLTDTPESYATDSSGVLRVQFNQDEIVRSAQVRVTAGLYSTLLPAMRWLIQYPYGCVEQVMSATVPNLVFAQLLKKNAAHLSKEEQRQLEEATTFAQAGMKRLQTYAKGQGGLSWFNSEAVDQGDVNMSLLSLMVLSSVSDPSEVAQNFQQTLQWLDQLNLAPTSPEGVVHSYIQSRFSKASAAWYGEETLVPKLKLQASYVMGEGSLLEKSLLAIALRSFEINDPGLETLRGELTRSLVSDIEIMIKNQNATSQANSQSNSRPVNWMPKEKWAAYPGQDASLVALLGRALRENISPTHWQARYTSFLRQELLKSFDGTHFGSTFETSMTLLNSEWLIQEEFAAVKKAAMPANSILLNGSPIAAAHVTRSETLGGLVFELDPEQLKAGSTLQVGGLSKDVVVRAVIRKGMRLKQSKEIQKGFQLSRRYFKLTGKGEKKPIDPSQEKLKVGDLLYVEVEFERTEARTPLWASRYYVLSEQVPAGFQVIDDDREYEAPPYSLAVRSRSYRVRELGSDTVRWYFDFSKGWMDRTKIVGFVMRANFAGSYQTGVTRIEDFYDDELFSQTQSRTLTVESFSR